MNTNSLTIPQQLRLRKAFNRYAKFPKFFSREFAAAQEAISDHEKYGWPLSVDRHGNISAQSPDNMKLTRHEMARFTARLPEMSDEEAASTRAAIVAIGTRGFTAAVDPRGKLLALPPNQVKRTDVSHEQKAKEFRAYWKKKGGQSAFKKP